MTRKSLIIGAGIAVALSAAAWGYQSSAVAQPYGGGRGMMGADHGMMGDGHGMMGGGYSMMRGGSGWDCPSDGPGWMQGERGHGRGWMHGGPGRFASGDLKLSTDDIKTQLDRWLTWRGNSRLKVGDVKEKDADTIVADVITKDNSLVQRLSVNRHTGDYDQIKD